MSTAVEPPARTRLAGNRAELLRQRLRAGWDSRPGIPRRPDGQAPPLSFAQERLWFMDQLVPDTAAYTVPRPERSPTSKASRPPRPSTSYFLPPRTKLSSVGSIGNRTLR